MAIIVTGGAGFIGSNFILNWLSHSDETIINIDKLTYAGNIKNLDSVSDDPRLKFVKCDIGDQNVIDALLQDHTPRAILNFAAESHVDRSIEGPAAFIQTNIVSTFHLLESTKKYWQALDKNDQDRFRFLHVSTDEVYGSLDADDPAFSETNQFQPNSPYAASKASSDHLVRAYHHTYGLPVLTTNCSNNYGPYQFPEKLIPLIIHRALNGENLPIYGDGKNIRDWLFVTDHCTAIEQVLTRGTLGETYNIGGNNEKTNIEVVETICNILDQMRPKGDGTSYKQQITFVKDRMGHDRRYAIDAKKIAGDIGWGPSETFETGLQKTVGWYLDHPDWINDITSGAYRKWVEKQYAT